MCVCVIVWLCVCVLQLTINPSKILGASHRQRQEDHTDESQQRGGQVATKGGGIKVASALLARWFRMVKDRKYTMNHDKSLSLVETHCSIFWG